MGGVSLRRGLLGRPHLPPSRYPGRRRGRLGCVGASSSPSLSPLLCTQVSNSHLRLVHLSPADSGEYMCREHGMAVPREASFVVSVLPGTSASSRMS